jgi:dihydrolipoamide dehydrogenase
MPAASHDLLVIGAGPGGYVAAIRAAQLGLNVGCVEKESALGGTCLRVGCIPSKALLESSELYFEANHNFRTHGIALPKIELDLAAMLKRKDQIVSTLTRGVDSLFKKNKISRHKGHARFEASGRVIVEGSEGSVEITAKHILIATGSVPSTLPGVELDGAHIGTSTEALAYQTVPAHLVVIGAGFIGLEMGSVWRRLGAKVTVIEFMDRILPGMDLETVSEAQKLFQKQGIEFRLGCRVTAARVEGQECIVESKDNEPLRCDRVLVAVGRRPNTQGLNLEKAAVKTDEKGRIIVDDNFATSALGVYAIGDVIRGPMLAHKAEEEGIACIEKIVTGHGHVDYNTIAGIVYTQPEIASVGKTEEELKQAGVRYKKGVFPFRANGRALALGHVDGKVKVLADAASDRVLGVHIIGPRAGDLIAEAATAMSFGASSEDLARTCHAHPTLSEAFREAALAVDGRALHM